MFILKVKQLQRSPAYQALLALVFLIIPPCLWATEYSLLQAYEIARESDPSLAFSRYRVDGSKAQRDVARGQMFPQISLFGDWSDNKVRYEETQAGQIPSQEYPGERYGLQMRAPLFNIRSWREYDRQKALVNQSEEELSVAEADLLGQVTSAYFEVLLANQNLEAFGAELTALEAELMQAQALYDKGLIAVTEVLETQTRLEALRADVIQAKGQVAISREALIQRVGIRDIEPVPVVESFLLPQTIGTAESAASLALQFDPASAAQERAVDAARQNISKEKGSWWPEIDFVFNSQYSDVGFDNLTSPPRSSESYSLSFRYPIFEGGAGSARLRGAWAEYYGAQQRLEEARRLAGGRARAAWVTYNAISERVVATQQALQAAEVNVAASQKAVKLGAGRVSDVLLALAQRTRAQRTLNQARFERALGWLELELSTGSDPVSLAPTVSQAIHGE